MKNSQSLLSSLALAISLTLGMTTSAIAYPRNHNRRVAYPSRYSPVTRRYYRNYNSYKPRYNRNYDRRDYGRGIDYHNSYYDNCRYGRRGRRNITITNPPIYRNNLSFPNYIRVRTVR